MEPHLHKDITLSTSIKINALGDQVIKADSVGNLQWGCSHYKT
jgi:hypothetical protein